MPACSQSEIVLLRTMWWPMALFVPAVRECALDGLHIALGGVGRGVVPLVAVFPQCDPRTSRVADHVVLDDPAFAPVGADQTDLLGCGRRPGGGRVLHRKPAHGDVVDARLFRIEHRPAHIDLHQLLIGIDPLELRPDRGVLLVHLAEPERSGGRRVSGHRPAWPPRSASRR